MIFSKPKGKKGAGRKFAIATFLSVALVFSLAVVPRPAKAQISIVGSIPDTLRMVFDKVVKYIEVGLRKTASAALQNVVRNSLNKVAYDAAVWIGSGKAGQKPLYETKDWKELLGNVRDDAIGTAIEDIGKNWNVNLCEPDLNAKLSIGLGLKNLYTPAQKPDCTWQKLKTNWSAEIDKDDFLKNFAPSFNPTGSDLGIALELTGQTLEEASKQESAKEKALVAKEGWLDMRNIGGVAKTFPGKSQIEISNSMSASAQSIGRYTGDALVDAANVFLNQLALSGFQTLMNNLTESGSKLAAKNKNLTSAEADPSAGGGAAGVKKAMSKITEARFDSRGDYDILSELSTCSTGLGGVGPTNCVIDDRFRQAIEQKKTVGQALKEGLLKKDSPFGFQTSGATAIEPGYLEGIPYRSMIILRKFRIIPVGWELAAQNINGDTEARKHAYLGQMVECFDENDSYAGYDADWCKGLVDPDWVLKAPQNYCAKEGYGPQIIFQQSVDQGMEMVEINNDVDGDGRMDTVNEDTNNNGIIDLAETDADADGNIDVNEDKDGDEEWDKKQISVKAPAKLMLNRLDTYCADEQSCIKEKSDGSCEYYGYCTEERRRWNFSSESCEPAFNSCQTFKREGGDSMSFLKDTLDFCDAEDFGCKKYAQASLTSYNSSENKVNWFDNDGFVYLNKNAQECDAENEGCHQFIRIKNGLGTNLIRNSSFESNDVSDVFDAVNGRIGSQDQPSATNMGANPERFWPIIGSFAEISDSAPDRAGKVLRINSAVSPAGLYSFDRSDVTKLSVLPQGFVMEPENSYTFSADVYLIGGERVAVMIGRDGQYWQEVDSSVTNRWITLSVTINNNQSILANEIRVLAYSSSGGVEFYIDNVKLEVSNRLTAYSEYAQRNTVFQKLLPNYLENACYNSPWTGDYSIRDDAPALCKQFVRKCSREEANCEMYTSVKDGSSIPAAVSNRDYCSAECNGFDTYIQSVNNFNSRRAFYFIPKTAKQCSAADVGCEEFTNLDKTSGGEGGENREYYSYLRQCVKPSATVTCAAFYTWEGNSESGEQLSKHLLQADATGNVVLTSPAVGGECDESVFNALPSDPLYNPDCRRFSNQAGTISYRLYSKTISCTEDCHPYRMTNKNIDQTIIAAASCTGASRYWDASIEACYSCINGGYWSVEHQSCIYNGTPAESASCSSGVNGCAEFNGNQGNNTKTLLVSSFENGLDGWVSAANIPVAMSGKWSIIVNNSAEASHALGRTVARGRAYTISFIAKPLNSTANINVYFRNSVSSQAFNTSAGSNFVTIKPDVWGVYTLNVSAIDHDVTDDEFLAIGTDNAVLIDNIRLTAITERYYLVRNSWVTPSSCNQDENGKSYPLYMLGCSEYKDRLGGAHYLHRFNKLCQESAVGCEALIDTQNSSQPEGQYFNGDNPVTIPADRLIYAVYDKDKKCSETSKGCQRLGLSTKYENTNSYVDTFLNNDPDKYSSILCSESGVGCDKWTSVDGDFYFKDPGEMVCEWRIGSLPGKAPDWAWFKKKVKRCGGTDAVCSTDKDCLSGVQCIIDSRSDEELACPVSSMKTFGFGGSGNEVFQPTEDGVDNWAGLCSAEQSGCTEYIDPVSDFSANLLYNYDLKQDIDGDGFADGWLRTGFANNGQQDVFLESGSLYVVSLSGVNANTLSISSPKEVLRQLMEDNTLDSFVSTLPTVNINSSIIFYVSENVKVSVVLNDADPTINSTIVLRKAVIDYQLAQNVDKSSCSGVANMDEGCVYFNERSYVNSSTAPTVLSKNSWSEYGGSVNTSPNVNNANRLLRVSPDRTCEQWLSCKTYVKGDDNKPVCFDIAECNRLDAGGSCANFVVMTEDKKFNRVYNPVIPGGDNAETIKNVSGYSKVSYVGANLFTKMPNNLLRFGVMSQDGKKVSVPNGDFELSNKVLNSKKNEYIFNPVGWSPRNAVWSSAAASLGQFKVINDPVTAQKLGVSYPVEGAGFLQYSPSKEDSFPISDAIKISRNQGYYLSFMINTSNLIGASGASAKVEVFGYGSTDDPLEDLYISGGLDWHRETIYFESNNNSTINISLGAEGYGSSLGGYIYVDDVKITPVLKANDIDMLSVPQSCRLFPKEDSLSCDYYDESGMRLRGDYGYCLEYDRPPGDPNTCLLWWPIDRVSGQGEGKNISASEIKGYEGPAPLFYCIGAETRRAYIDASDTYWTVDETISVSVNGVDVLGGEVGFNRKGNRAGQSAVMSSYMIDTGISSVAENRVYLNPGVNTVSVSLDSDAGGGATFLTFGGRFHYWDYERNERVGVFNVTNQGTARTSEVSDSSFGGNARIYHCEIDRGGGVNLAINNFFVGGDIDDSIDRYWFAPENGGNEDGECDYGGSIGGRTVTFTITIPRLACSNIVQVVDKNGLNKAWVERVKESTDYASDCNEKAGLPDWISSSFVYNNAEGKGISTAIATGSCYYSADDTPFGSVRAPGNNAAQLASPSEWGALNGDLPLLYRPPADARMGQLYSRSTLSNLFAESYGVWDWDNDIHAYVPNLISPLNWDSPLVRCDDNIRRNKNENCSIAPKIDNIKLNNKTANAEVLGRGFINLSFTSSIDPQQMPLTSYEIDWGDGEKLVVSGSDMKTMSDPNNPHSTYHAYDYWDMYSKSRELGAKAKMPTLTCNDSYCTVKPKIKIADNWGWCTEGHTDNPCPTPTTAVCISAGGVVGAAQRDCRDYTPGDLASCPAAFIHCGDGYYETSGIITVRNYVGE